MAWISLNWSVFFPIHNGSTRLAPTQHDWLRTIVQHSRTDQVLPCGTACPWGWWRLDRWPASPQHIELQIRKGNLRAERYPTRKTIQWRTDNIVEKTIKSTRRKSRNTQDFTYKLLGAGKWYSIADSLRHRWESRRILRNWQNWINYRNRTVEEWILPWWDDWSQINLWQPKLQKCDKRTQNKVSETSSSLWLSRKK